MRSLRWICTTALACLLLAVSGAAQSNNSLSPVILQFVTDDHGALVPQAFTYNASPCPEIEANVTNVTISSDGVATVTVSGVVHDAVSDVVSNPLLQVQSIGLSVEGVNQTTGQLINTASPQLPWRPYAFEGSYSVSTLVDVRPTAFVPPPDVGATKLQLQTSTNAAGCSSVANLDLSVEDHFILTHAGQSSRGTYKPTLLRLASPSPLPPDTQIFAFGQFWPVQEFNFGDGEFWYAIDGGGNPVVFAPAEGAPPNGNVQQLAGDFLAEVFINGVKIGQGDTPTQHGLVVWQNDVTNLLNMSLKNYTTKTFNEQKDGQKQNVYVYGAGDGFDHLGNTVIDEILWREVGQPVMASVFNSANELNTDNAYRKGIVDSTAVAGFGFGNLTVNRDFWNRFYRVKDIGADTSACAAIGDMFGQKCDGSDAPRNNSDKYSMGCFQAAQFLVMRGASLALKNPLIDSILGTRTDLTYMMVRTTRDLGGNSVANWLPGDWGYISNQDPILDPDLTNTDQKLASFKWKVQNPNWRLWQGENIFYLGGSFTTDAKMFSANAMFWGHINRRPVRVLDQWIVGVNNFPTPNPKAKLLSTRESLRQPQVLVELATDATMEVNAFAGGTITIDQVDYEVVRNTAKEIFIRTLPLVHFGIKAKGGGATVTGNMYNYFAFLDARFLNATDILMKEDQFEGGTLMIGGADYTVLSNTTTAEGVGVISLNKDAMVKIPFAMKKGTTKLNGNILFVDFAR